MKKTLLVLGCFLLLIVVALVLFRLPYAPRPVVNEAELLLVNSFIPEQSNGVPVLLKAGTLISLTDAESGDLYKLIIEFPQDETRTRSLIAKNKAALEAFHEAFALPGFDMRSDPAFEFESSYLMDWRYLTYLALLQAALLFHEGNESIAFESVLEIMRYGEKVEVSGRTLQYQIGAGNKMVSADCLIRFAEHTKLSSEELVSIERKLGGLESQDRILYHVLKVEYAAGMKTHDALSAELSAASGFMDSLPRLFYNSQRSKADLAMNIHGTLMAITNCFAVGNALIPKAQTNMSIIWIYLRGNPTGEFFNDMSLSLINNLLVQKCRENVSIRAARTIIALRAYQITNGKLPQTLSELTPNFIESVPFDDFDGKPLRYIAASNMIYSVGQDLVDSGGEKSSDREKGDIVFLFGF